jgi:hypothetical protein
MGCARLRRALLGLLTICPRRRRTSQTIPWYRPSRLALRASSFRADNLEEGRLLHGSHLHLISTSKELLLPAPVLQARIGIRIYL